MTGPLMSGQTGQNFGKRKNSRGKNNDIGSAPFSLLPLSTGNRAWTHSSVRSIWTGWQRGKRIVDQSEGTLGTSSRGLGMKNPESLLTDQREVVKQMELKTVRSDPRLPKGCKEGERQK